MTSAEWIALAERCEKATGLNDELDEAISRALGLKFFGVEEDGWWIYGAGDAIARSAAFCRAMAAKEVA